LNLGEKLIMAGFKINIFYVISAICTLILIGYFWSVFLPLFEDSFEYLTVRTLISFLTVLLLAVVGIQVFLAIRREKEPE